MDILDNDRIEQQRIREQIIADNSLTFRDCVRSYFKLYRYKLSYSSAFENFQVVLKELGLYVGKEIDELRYELAMLRFDDSNKNEDEIYESLLNKIRKTTAQEKEIATLEKEEAGSNEIELRINEEFDAFEKERSRLKESGEYIYVEQFVKKFGRVRNSEEMWKLRELLALRGYLFSDKQMKSLLNFAFAQQRFIEAKKKILDEKPFGARGIIQTFLNFYRYDDNEMLYALQELMIEKELYKLFQSDADVLRDEVEKVHKEIEMERFEKRLLSADTEILGISEIDTYDGYEFESFLDELFSKMGYSVEQTKLSGDQGADVVVVKFGERTVIQAKRFQGNVGNHAVQEIMAAISLYNAQQGMVVTNSYFTKSAKELAAANNVELIDRDVLEKLIRENW